jgi:hypothetical protein
VCALLRSLDLTKQLVREGEVCVMSFATLVQSPLCKFHVLVLPRS